jgi:hypothetical protein
MTSKRNLLSVIVRAIQLVSTVNECCILHKIEGTSKRSALTLELFVEVAARVFACNSFHQPTQTLRPSNRSAFQSVRVVEEVLYLTPTLPLPIM